VRLIQVVVVVVVVVVTKLSNGHLDDVVVLTNFREE